MEPREAGVVILAAGRSERMKEMKALLPYNDNTRFVEKIISTYSNWGCSEIIVVTNPEVLIKMKQMGMVPSTVTVVVNDHIGFERFYSVKLGLGAILSSSFCFIQNVDNPFVHSQILDLLYECRNNKKYITPVFKNRGGHPVLVNHENIRRICNWSVNSANFKVVLSTMECLEVEMPDERVLININSPEEYKRFFTVLQNGINL
jgi:CTP:molybdopterin cytidylyltransferase MocA